MKTFFLTAILSLFAATAGAQTLKPEPATDEEIRGMLELLGAHAWRFDLSELADKEYNFRPYFDEYVGGEKVVPGKDFPFPLGSRLRSGEMAESLAVLVAPKNDSTMMARVSLRGSGDMSLPLKLRTLETLDEPRYDYRQFKITATTGRIPLVLVGSWWYDERNDVHRFCAANEFAPDLSDEDLQFIPHFYIIGVDISEVK